MCVGSTQRQRGYNPQIRVPTPRGRLRWALVRGVDSTYHLAVSSCLLPLLLGVGIWRTHAVTLALVSARQVVMVHSDEQVVGSGVALLLRDRPVRRAWGVWAVGLWRWRCG